MKKQDAIKKESGESKSRLPTISFVIDDEFHTNINALAKVSHTNINAMLLSNLFEWYLKESERFKNDYPEIYNKYLEEVKIIAESKICKQTSK